VNHKEVELGEQDSRLSFQVQCILSCFP
jgi:hypothetical protein